MKTYYIEHHPSHERAVVDADSAQEACEKKGWLIGDCFVTEAFKSGRPAAVLVINEETKEQQVVLLDLDAVAKQTASNLVRAGKITEAQVPDTIKTIQALEASTVMSALLESHNLAEGTCLEFHAFDFDNLAAN